MKQRMLSAILAVVMLFGAYSAAVFAAGPEKAGTDHAKALIVDASAEEAGSSYQTIQDAVDYVAGQQDPAGWTIQVKPGEYDRFTVKSPVADLTIDGKDAAEVTINVLNSEDRLAWDNGGINVWAPNVTLKNLTVKAGESKKAWADAAISTNNGASGGAGNSLTVDSCKVVGPGVGVGALYGIFWNCDRVEVKNSAISGFSNAIEFMLDGYSIPADKTYRMNNNRISDCSFAIHGYMGGNQGPGTLEIANNTIAGTEAIRAKVIVQDNATKTLKANIYNNQLENVVVGTVNLQDEGDKNNVLKDNDFGEGCFYVDAIEPGTIEFYTTYQAPEKGYGHWELHSEEGIEHKDVVLKAIEEANKAGSHTLSITGIDEDNLIKTFTWFKDAIYWVTDPKPADPVEPLSPADPDWEHSKSKTATNLDSNFESKVTLSLPSAEKPMETDVVFVFDESSCSAPVKTFVGQLLEKLYAQQKATGAVIKVGAVQFRGETTEFELAEINDQTKEALSQFMGQRPKTGGSNMSMGILAGEAMLDADTSVEADRKYMILVSDGITYIWDDPATEEQENIGVNFSNADTPNRPFLASPDGWDVKYGNGYVPENWSKHLTEVGKGLTDTISQKGSTYVRSTDISDDPFVKPNDQWRYLSTVDISLFMSNQAYQQTAAKYHTYVCLSGVETEMKTYPYGPSFMQYLAGDKPVTFEGIMNEILYLVDAGSTVEDYMGYVKDDYNFDFVNDAPELSLTIGKEPYEAEKIEEHKYGFKQSTAGYAHVLEYIPGNMEDTERFVWHINEPITNFDKVQLTYTVKLANPKNAAGVYGEYDRDGSQNKNGLFTNNSAVLTPVDSKGNQLPEEAFNKPTVSYVNEEPSKFTPDPKPKPDKPDKPGEGGLLNTTDHFAYIIGYPVDYITGEPTNDQTRMPVKPQGKITRAEVATIYFRMLTEKARNDFWTQENSFSDVSLDDWFNNAVSTMASAGIVEGYPDGTFRPNAFITRAEFAAIAVRFFDVTYNGADLFPDIDGHWAREYINKAAFVDLVEGYPDGTFGPNRQITRAEAVTLVNRTLDRHPDKDHLLPDMLRWPDNMDTDQWYYADMQEATNSHAYSWMTNHKEDWTHLREVRDWAAFEKAWSTANSAHNPGEVVKKGA